jgi:hypothetical protein
MSLDEIKEEICRAITERKVVQFWYKDKPRLVEPYICGVSAANKYILLGFQTGGHSSSRRFGWKLFELANITGLEISDVTFNISGAERLRYSPNDPRMKKTFCCVPRA